jgi:hypothetical protein
MKDVKTRWAVYDEGLKVWYDGELVAKIHPSDFKYLIKDLAEHLAWQDDNAEESIRK